MEMKFIYDDSIASYDFGPGHPFRGDRFPSFVEFIKERGEPFDLSGYVGDPPTIEDLRAVHDDEYLNFLRTRSRTGHGMVSLDTPAFRGMWEAALSMVHSSMSAVRVALREGAAAGFGGAHHASVNYGGGFCLLNDVAIAARWALRNGVGSVAIFDHDAHHGNGTMEIFYEDDTVLYVSLHQDPTTIYPGVGFARQVGRGRGEGYTVNVPLPPGAGPASYEMAFEELVRPIVESFAPKLLVAHGGSDPHFLDPLTQLGLDLRGLWRLGLWASSLPADHRVELLISGYNEDVRNWGWLGIVRGFATLDLGFDPEGIEGTAPREDEYVIRRARLAIDDAKSVLSKYWNLS